MCRVFLLLTLLAVAVSCLQADRSATAPLPLASRLVVVIMKGAAIDAEPGDHGAILSTCQKGQYLAVDGTVKDDYRVVMERGSGYIAKKNVKLLPFEAAVGMVKPRTKDETVRETVVVTSMSYLGSPFPSHDGRFIQKVFAKQNVALPEGLSQQRAVGRPIALRDTAQWLPGDRFYFALKRQEIDHAAIYLGDGLFIHPTIHADHQVRVDKLNEYYRQRLIAIRRSESSH